MPSTSQHIQQTGTKIGLCPWRVLSERVPKDSQTSGSVRSTSDFASSVPARNTCLAQVTAHHDMTACLCVSLFIGRGVLDEHACSCVAQCKAFRAGAAQGRLGCSTTRARQPSLQPQEVGPDYRNESDLRPIQFFRLHGDTGRGVLKRGSDHTAIKVVQTGPGLPVNPRNGIRRTHNNLAIALSRLGIPLQIPSGVPCVRQ